MLVMTTHYSYFLLTRQINFSIGHFFWDGATLFANHHVLLTPPSTNLHALPIMTIPITTKSSCEPLQDDTIRLF